MSEYIELKKVTILPRVPSRGNLDLTYRCNNNCRHCWLRIPPDAIEKNDELTIGEIKKIVDEARIVGSRKWSISGGEPMLREDFAEIFDYITATTTSCALNTNGTLITPKIAKLMKRNSANGIALYGATADVHDRITRTPGSFEAMMRGISYLKEAGADFTIQLFLMKNNRHQYEQMLALAKTLTPSSKLGGAWLHLCASGNPRKNDEIIEQRLDPSTVVGIDLPDIYISANPNQVNEPGDGNLLSCLKTKRGFHIDPYGKMTFCPFIKDDQYRYDLKKGGFQDGWSNFIPASGARLRNQIQAEKEYTQNCKSCKLKDHCRWCPVFGFLEHGKFSAKVGYLCEIAIETKKFRENWEREHRAFYKIADITIQVDSDLPITEKTFRPKFKKFQVLGGGNDTITIMHHFSVPDISNIDLGQEVYRKIPWAIYRKKNSWIYAHIVDSKEIHQIVEFNDEHTQARIYSNEYRKDVFLNGNVNSLTLFPTDQVLIARILADRQGCYIHSSGIILDGKGYLFAGKSGAGKSTIAGILKKRVEILCDDRVIVRKRNGKFNVYGTWSHGDLPDVSANFAPLRGLFFLEKAVENKITPLEDKNEILKRLLAVLIKPLITKDWWEKTFAVIEGILDETPCYILHFDKTERIIKLLEKL
ncbi:MAG: radical SAM protein [Thermodesulfovibrionales bacterium]|nr:radical SAM protein [Thermodesulfovibrionales bacterium]